MRKSVISLVIALLVGAFLLISINGCFSAKEANPPDILISSYQECEDIYFMCNKICFYIAKLNYDLEKDFKGEIPEPKREALRTKFERDLNKHIKEYNEKTDRIPKVLWDLNSLPYKLNRWDFYCYLEKN